MVRHPLTAEQIQAGQRLGVLLREARADRDPREVARTAGISPETLRKIETGPDGRAKSRPARIGDALCGDPLLRPLIQLRPGLRIPGVWEPFECCVRAIVAKQTSVAAARTLLGRLVQCLGQPIESVENGITHLFPTPEAIASANLEALGIYGMRRCAMQVIARGIRDHTIDFNESNRIH